MADDRDTVTVVWGPEKFSPVQFHTMDLGPFSMTTKVQQGESPEEAIERSWRALDKMARRLFVEKRKDFMDRVREVGSAFAEASGRR